MMKIVTVLGARPQFIKSAVFSRYVADQAGVSEVLVHTGQHFDANMSDVFFSEMNIPKPQYQLSVGGGGHGSMTGRMLEKVEELLLLEKPDVVLVYGDTNSTLAGALAAAKLHIPVAHVEAGLRSFNRRMPEEINRILTDEISEWLFTPSETANVNLRREGIDSAKIHMVGDIMYEAALFYKETARPSPAVQPLLAQDYYLTTIHRAENTDHPDRLRSIFEALEEVGADHPVVLPLHPRTRKFLGQMGISTRNIRLLDPVGYFDMLSLLGHCRAVVTDSGGVQKEAYFFGKPCITMRDQTEWTELVELGVNRLVGADRGKIVAAVQALKSFGGDFSQPIYGDGQVASRILGVLRGA